MTQKHSPSTFLKTVAIVALAVLLLFTGTAAAEKSVFIDVNDVEGTVEVGKTVLVPVKVSGAENLYSIELKCGLADNEDYTIAFDDSIKKYFYSPKTGKVAQINLNDENGNPINGDATLFKLEVTLKTGEPVPLSLTSYLIQEGTEDTEIKEVTYTAKGATLTVEGGNTPAETPTPTVTPSPTETTPTPTVTPSPTETSGSSGGDSQPGSSTILPGTSTPSETIPTFTPTTSPTDDAPKTSGSYLPYVIAVLGVLAVLIIIIIIVKRRSDNE